MLSILAVWMLPRRCAPVKTTWSWRSNPACSRWPTAGGTGTAWRYDGTLTKRQWLRQTQSTFGWDWSPRLINVGIGGSCGLKSCRLAPGEFRLPGSGDGRPANGQVTGRAYVEGFGPETIAGEMSVEIAETGQRLAQPVQIKPGMNHFELTLKVDQPELWWPVNHGAQPLYQVSGSIQGRGSEARAEKRLASGGWRSTNLRTRKAGVISSSRSTISRFSARAAISFRPTRFWPAWTGQV